MKDNSNLPEVLTVPEIAQYLKISRSLAYELAQRPDFPKIKINRTIRVTREAFLHWISNNQAGELDTRTESLSHPGRGAGRRIS